MNKNLKTTTIDAMGAMLDSVKSGDTSPLRAYLYIKSIIKTLENPLKLLYEGALEEAESHGTASFSAHGYQVQVKGGTTWKFPENIAVIELEKQLKEAKAQAKTVFDAMAKNQVPGSLVEIKGVNPVTGEEFIIPIPVHQNNKISISLKS